MRRPFVAVGTVRYVGQPVVAVIAEDRYQASDAADLVVVDYDPLPVVIAVEDGLRDEVLLFPDAGTNVVQRWTPKTEADFSACEVIVEERIVNQRLTAAPIEPRSGAACWTDDGRLVHYSACQGAHPTTRPPRRDLRPRPLAGEGRRPRCRRWLRQRSRAPIPKSWRIGFYARAVGRPVSWTETRSENMVAMPHGRGQTQRAKLGGTRDGRITAYHLDVIQDAGAFPLMGALLPMMTMRMATGVYEIPNVSFNGVTTVTNTVSTTAYRGAGRPEAAVAIERMVDRFAGRDRHGSRRGAPTQLRPALHRPVHDRHRHRVRRRRLSRGARARARRGRATTTLRNEQARRREDGDPVALGIGIAVYVEITAGAPGSEFGAVELLDGGRLRVRSGSTPFGQGHDTTWAMVVSERTGVPIDRIEVIHGDTDLVRSGGLTVGSRSVQIGGAAIDDAHGRARRSRPRARR